MSAKAAPRMSVTLTVDELATVVRDAVRSEMRLRAAEDVTDAPEIMTREQVGELLQVHPKVVSEYINIKGLPGFKVGPHWRFRRAAVLAWLDKEGGR